MFNIGFSEFLTIGIIALLVIGPKQLPEVARVVGRLLNELKRATQELTGGFMEAGYELKNSLDETRQEIMTETEKIKNSITDTDIDNLEESFNESHNKDPEVDKDHQDPEINNQSEEKKS